MKEDFLHFLWLHKKLTTEHLITTQNEPVQIINVGHHNSNSGPDFFNAQLKIGDQIWAGNVEIHVKSSDWYVHNHEKDQRYDNVILHVVWEHDFEVYRRDNSSIPTLELKHFVIGETLENYKRLFSKKQYWINCEKDFASIDDFVINNWLERLYFERLERKTNAIEALLVQYNNDWEAVLFMLLAKGFGLKVNGDAFFSVAKSIDFSIIRKSQSNLAYLEALLFGQSGLLDDQIEHPYFISLQSDYTFLKNKYHLSRDGVFSVQFFRLRPPNFPTIRLAQLAVVYHRHHHVFSKIISFKNIDQFYAFFEVQLSQFWDHYYTFSTASKISKKNISKAFVDLLIINTIIPIKFCHAQRFGYDANDDILKLVQSISSESNAIIKQFNSIKKLSKSALQSQALLQLKSEYCDKNKCLKCAVGNVLLK